MKTKEEIEKIRDLHEQVKMHVMPRLQIVQEEYKEKPCGRNTLLKRVESLYNFWLLMYSVEYNIKVRYKSKNSLNFVVKYVRA